MTETAMDEWIGHLARTKMLRERKAVAAFLGELACAPWKFDVLWELWPHLAIDEHEYRQLASELFSGKSDETVVFGGTVFDDMTIFCDLVGDDRPEHNFPRPAYRAAFLCMRPITSRTSLDLPPFPPLPVTSDKQAERVAFAILESPDAAPNDVSAALRVAASRYAARGKAEGVTFCRQTAALVEELSKPEIKTTLPNLLHQSTFQLYISADSVALANEFALQWYRVFRSDFADRLQAAAATDADAAAALAHLRESFAKLRPLHWLLDERPGVAAAATISTLLRVDSGRTPSFAFAFFPTTWVEACQECVMLLKKKWSGTPKVPSALLHQLLEIFIEMPRHLRQQ